MTHADPRHDTDPAPARGNGHGHDDSPYPCAVHEAAIVEGRKTMVEVRDALRAVAGHLDTEIAERKKWAGDIEYAMLETANAIKALTATIGTAPDPSTGTPGTGMRGQIAVAINHTLRAAMPSLADGAESEITAVQDRDTLLGRARVAEKQSAQAEALLIDARARARRMTIAAVAAAGATLIAAAAAAMQMLGG